MSETTIDSAALAKNELEGLVKITCPQWGEEKEVPDAG